MSAGSERIRKGFGGAGRRTELVGGFGRKSRNGEKVHSPSPSPFSSEPPSHALFFSPHPPNPLRILPDTADEIMAERGIMGGRVADRCVWEGVGSR